MTSTDYYLLHPVAWAVCQEVLEAEAAMIASGQSANQRVLYLENERLRILAAADITLREAHSEVLHAWGLADAGADLAAIRERFRIHGNYFTFRESRNRLRRLGLEDNSMAALAILGLLMVDEHSEVASAIRRVFEPRIQRLTSHPEVVRSVGKSSGIVRETGGFSSDRERALVALAQDVFSRMTGDVAELLRFDRSEYRDLACIRGTFLDMSIVDVLEVAIANGLIPEVRQMLQASVDDGLEIYRTVVSSILGERIATVRSGQGAYQTDANCAETEKAALLTPTVPDTASPPAPDPAPEEPAEGLLSVAQTAKLLNVSRSTLGRMETDGILLPVRLGRAVRYDPKTIDDFLVRSRNT